MKSKLSKLFFSLFLFSSAALYGSAEGLYNIETCSPEIKQEYVKLIANFIQEQIPGNNTVIIKNCDGTTTKLSKINKKELCQISTYAKTRLARYYARIENPKVLICSTYLNFIATTCPRFHQDIDRTTLELNIHKTLLYMLGFDIKKLQHVIRNNSKCPFFMLCIKFL
ncbi:hypothetical protein K2W90_02410 [Candidatus Babeliales bacterium]|nr:hypothetical protein [Candidatus Babeliales bacterium]